MASAEYLSAAMAEYRIRPSPMKLFCQVGRRSILEIANQIDPRFRRELRLLTKPIQRSIEGARAREFPLPP